MIEEGEGRLIVCMIVEGGLIVCMIVEGEGTNCMHDEEGEGG